ncbi:MAG TPA: hypothetical protein VJN90_02875 [Candidatus Acidoferrales bacterium]|nr:hypothetical protein [Candidatus Acidoferrales bacterium]
MANRAYASIWVQDFSEETLLNRWREFLHTVPVSTERPGFSELVIRAIDTAETPILEQDLRSGAYDANVLVDLASEHVHSDSSYETQAWWDLWIYNASGNRWELKPQPLAINCYGEEFDEGFSQEQGHFLVDTGFEHAFTGHAGLLGFAGGRPWRPEHPDEANFVALMSQPENLRTYHEKTRANIRKLYDWMARLESVLPVERYRLWSEGEENFEARMEEILAVR